MKALLEAMEADSRFRIDRTRSSVNAYPRNVKGDHEVHLHLCIEPKPATVLDLGGSYFQEADRQKRDEKARRFWMDVITDAIRKHAPGAEPAWAFEEPPDGSRITLGAVKTMGREETERFLKIAKEKGLR